MTHYIGVDIAGASNTWFTSLTPTDDGLSIAVSPHIAALTEIITFVDDHDVVAACIDAQLTIAPSDNTGFRSADTELRSLLPNEFQNWVASINSLMAVPVRGRLLADSITASVATIIETHPRASLYFGTPEELQNSIANYKGGPNAAECTRRLWDDWSARYRIDGELVTITDGSLDSIICATVAYLCHTSPAQLYRLRHNAPARVGHGPFYVLSPAARPKQGM
ncbi:hypothetical protein C5Y96_03115 [Blastopirellula marina]|uniref:DUF429 domain-containing protein n=1 Tax=Blastopirellula marina TaxID=124 RepID=A0A2S8G348_9BACT|nr:MULTISPECIES: DUF429 domain-containing protein [Pirellulaceae]PQO38876.1 hypothetical protein C5Y96_03115 [Blastopirellula marina]RCS55184.1 DUF429 domain-containing protein [Bremerella cremea]